MKLPAGPSLTPAEQTFLWFSRPYAFLDECAATYGEVFTVNFQALGPHVFFSKPSWIKAVFSGDAAQLLGGQGKEMLRPFLGDTSLLLTDGPLYQKHRKILLPLFRSPVLDGWKGRLPERVAFFLSQTKLETGVHDFFLELSLKLILDAIFGEQARQAEWTEATLEFMHSVSFNPMGAGAEGSKAMEQLDANRERMDKMVFAEIRRQKANPVAGSILGELVMSQTDGGAAREWAEVEIRDEVMTLLIAGHETTATTLAWAAYELARSPSILLQLTRELRSVGDEARPKVAAVLKEGMRLWPVIPVVARKLAAPFALGEWTFAEGVHLVPCTYLAHRRPDVFPEPTRFMPERFLEKTPAPHEYFPFGGGVRRCLGMAMAGFEMEEIFMQLFRDFDVVFHSAEKVRPSRRSVAIVPSGPFRMELKKRL